MKKAAKRACTKIAGCPAFTCESPNCKARRIKTHRAQEKPQERVERSKLYSTAGWGKMRSRQLSNAPLCQRCAQYDLVTPAVHVDHVVPHKGDRKLVFDAGNLQSLCHSCHSHKTNLEKQGMFEDYR
jgi:5-methylcytosine-specific restriction protein A